MKLSDLLSDNKNVACIKLYSATHGITISNREESEIEQMLSDNHPFFIFLSDKGCELFPVKTRSKLLGQIVGHRVKCGTVLYFHDGSMREVTSQNWHNTWQMITPRQPKEIDDKITVPMRKRTAFDDGMPDRPHKKPAKKGFIRTHNANISMHRLNMAL